MNNYYCVLPFYSIEADFSNPKNVYCCRLKPGTDIEQVRDDIRKKQRSPNCATCWDLEDRGQKSERQLHNESLDFFLDLSIDNIELASLASGFNPVKIKLTTSNLCNGQCVTCNSHLSSAWAALENKSSQYKGLDLGQLDIDWGKIVSLSFVGGEPLLEKKNFAVLENLIEHNNTNCAISFVTNGSVELAPHQLEILQKFKRLNVCLSIDGTGKVFEYIRYPLKWDTLLTNISFFKTITNDISVSFMVSNLNIYYYSELVDFFKANNLQYLAKQITHPVIFSPGNLPSEAKSAVIDNNKKYEQEVKSFLSMPTYSETNFDNFKTELLRQEVLKKIQLEDYLPELWNLL